MNFSQQQDSFGTDEPNKPSKKKPIFPVTDGLRGYLKHHGREVKLPVSYKDLLHINYAVPLKDKNGKDTLWEAVSYDMKHWNYIREGLVKMYAILKTEGDMTFTKHLDAISDRWRSRYGPATLVNWPGNAMRAPGNEGVAARINQSVGSIGYVSYEFARKLNLKIAALENRSGHFVTLTGQTSEAALASAELPDNLRLFMPDPPGPEAYPIVTFSWILLYPSYEDPKKAKAVRELFRWCLADGQNYAAQLGYVKLPQSVTARALTALDSLK